MSFRLLCIVIFSLFSLNAIAAECTLYEKSHPNYPLTGSHLSTGKCSTCASCHVPAGNAVFLGTPKTCIACHNGDPRFNTVKRSAAHLPTLLLDCAGCHNTTAFNSFVGITQTMIHNTGYPTVMCKGCHNGMYTAYNAQGKSRDHPTTVTRNGVKIVVDAVDCNYSGCHSPNSSSFDN
jgi:hypothetical protein